MPTTSITTVVAPIFYGDQSQAVADLQTALQKLGYPISKDFNSGFSDETCRAVAAFKKNNEIPSYACYIDKQTAEKLNQRITQQNPNARPISFGTLPIFFGTTSDDVKKLQAALVATGFGEVNGTEVTNGNFGSSTCKIVMNMKQLLQITPTECYVDPETAAKINELLASPEQSYSVSGYVTNPQNEKISGQLLLAYDIDLKGARLYRTAKTLTEFGSNGGVQFLGSAISDVNGYYKIYFPASAFPTNEFSATDPADVIVLAFQSKLSTNQQFPDDNNPIVGRSALSTSSNYTGYDLVNWNVRLDVDTVRGETEYAALTRVLSPFLQTNSVAFSDISDSSDQVNFLASETDQDPGRCLLAAQADKLRTEYLQTQEKPQPTFTPGEMDVFDELLYGIGRQKITLSWVAILQKTASQLTGAINQSITQNVIGQKDSGLLDDFVKNLLNFSLQQSVTAPETAGFYKTIGFSITDAELQKAFAKAYLQFSGNPADFWDNLGKQAGFTPVIVQSLQLTNQLSILTGQHIDLVEELQVKRAIKDPSDLLSLKDEDWNAIISKLGVPASSPGNSDQEKVFNYVRGMKNVLNASYPTKRIALMTANNEIPIRDANIKEKVIAFFSVAKGFDISTSRITSPAFAGIIKNVGGDLSDKVQQHLQVMQRIYQVSPTPEVMSTLISKGYGSAFDISSRSQNTFIEMEAVDLGGADIAFSVYNRARYQVTRAQYIFQKIRDTQDKAIPSRIISTGQQQAINTLLNTLNS